MAWADIRGQSLALRVLQADLVQQRVAPAYLFAGPEGVGKRLTAAEMAKALNCEEGFEGPCDRCDSCRRMARDVHPDLCLVSGHGASEAIRIDEVRQALARIALRPFMARYQVVIIDGAQRLTEEAGNLLLKSLEEPPSQARFLLISPQPTACLPTIVSRCKLIRFQRLSAEHIEAHLMSQGWCTPEVAASVNRLAQGSLSKAVTLAAQWDSYRAMVAHLGSSSPTAWLEWAVPTDRQELSQWLACAVAWLRDIAVAGAADDSLIHHYDAAASIRRQAQRLDRERCVETAMRLIALWESLEQMANPRLVGTLLREHCLALLCEVKGERCEVTGNDARR